MRGIVVGGTLAGSKVPGDVQGSTLGGSRLFPYLSDPDELREDLSIGGKLATRSIDAWRAFREY